MLFNYPPKRNNRLFLKHFSITLAFLLCAGSAFAFGGGGGRSAPGLISTTYKAGVDAIGIHFGGDTDIPCPEHSTKIQGLCICDEYYTPDGVGGCVADQCLDYEPTDCMPDCNPITGEALAGNEGGYCNNKTGRCSLGVCLNIVCNPCEDLVDGLCVARTCGEGEVCNTAQDACVCDNDHDDIDGICYLKCDAEKETRDSNHNCICDNSKSFYGEAGNCFLNKCLNYELTDCMLECDPLTGNGIATNEGDYCENQTGRCVQGTCEPISCSAYPGAGVADSENYNGDYAGIADDGQTECHCPTGYTWQNGACVDLVCPQWANVECGSCTPAQGYVPNDNDCTNVGKSHCVNGKCLACGANEFWNTSTNSCQPCGDDTSASYWATTEEYIDACLGTMLAANSGYFDFVKGCHTSLFAQNRAYEEPCKSCKNRCYNPEDQTCYSVEGANRLYSRVSDEDGTCQCNYSSEGGCRCPAQQYWSINENACRPCQNVTSNSYWGTTEEYIDACLGIMMVISNGPNMKGCQASEPAQRLTYKNTCIACDNRCYNPTDQVCYVFGPGKRYANKDETTGYCVCAEGYEEFNNECVEKCADGYQRNQETGECELICSTNSECSDLGTCMGCMIPDGADSGTCQYACQEVEYLESTGTQWIDTQKSLGNPVDFYIDVKAQLTLIQDAVGLWGAYNNRRSGYLYLRSPRIETAVGGSMMTCSFSAQTPLIENPFEIRLYINTSSKQQIVSNLIDGTALCNANYTDMLDTDPISIFGVHKNSTTTNELTKMKLFYFKYVIDDNLVRDFVPVLDPDGTPAMLDRVENKLYYNQGSGQFLYGPVVNE